MESIDYFEQHLDDIIDDIKLLVKAESPSTNKQLADQCKEVLQGLFQSYFGRKAHEFQMDMVGNHLKFTYGQEQPQILLVGHYDTVWEQGKLTCHETEDKLYGPGVLDMKSSLVSAIWCLKYIHEIKRPIRKKIVLFINSDEEIGSHLSRTYIEDEAKKSEAAFILEPPVAGTGALKTARKGTANYLLTIKGVSAHAGNNPEDGASAIHEAAEKIIEIEGLTDFDKGTTLNVGMVTGGGKLNVVPNEAKLGIDVRAKTKAEQERIDQYFDDLCANDERINVYVDGGINRPPMERTSKTERLFEIAEEEAEELGFEIDEASVGGGSDGNFTAQLTKTLDGMGLVGEGIHAEHEHILKEHITQRMALLTNTILEVIDE